MELGEWRGWRGVAALIVPVALVHFIFGGLTGTILTCSTALAAASLTAWRATTLPKRARIGVVVFAMAWASNAVGDVVSDTWSWWAHVDAPYPGLADIFYLAFYPLATVGLAIVARRRSPGGSRSDLIDTAIVTVGAGVVFWQFFILPAAAETDVGILERLVSTAYPSGDLVLLAIVARLALVSGRRSPALKLLLGALSALLVADLVYLWSEFQGSYTAGSAVDALYDVSYLLLAASMLHPTFPALLVRAERTRPRVQWGRLLLLTAASLLAPIIAATRVSGTALVPIAASGLLFLLVMTRVGSLMRTLERSGERRFRSLVQHSADYLLVIDQDGRIQFAGPSASRELDLEPAALAAGEGGLVSLVHADDLSGVIAALAALDGSGAELEARLRLAGGTWRTMAITLTDLQADADVGGIVVNAHDIHELRLLASYDPLTGLANRSRFGAALEDVGRTDLAHAVLLLDLDGFKEINDSLGHEAGDRVLVETARRIEALARRGDVVARLGGDEFAVLLVGDEGGPVFAEAAAERLVRAIAEPVLLDELAVAVGVSIGIAGGAAGKDANELMRTADLAMYAAKGSGRGRAVTYDSAMGERAVHRLELRAALESAMTGGQLELHYQPTFELQDGVLFGFEALLRWNHPERGWISPAEFIPAAEESNQIVLLGRWVLDQATRQLGQWHRAHPTLSSARMSVNLSPRQLSDANLVVDVRRSIIDAGIPADRLCLEITEGALMANPGAATTVLGELAQLGVRLAIDDYGSGNASINYVRRFPVHELKIDRSLVECLGEDAGESAAFVRSITDLARILGLETVGEGIETESQRATLAELGCDVGQGYLLARPMAADAVTRFLAGFVAGEHVIPSSRTGRR